MLTVRTLRYARAPRHSDVKYERQHLLFDVWRGRTATGLHNIELTRPSAPDALVDEAERSHLVRPINIAQTDDDGPRDFALQAFQIECADRIKTGVSIPWRLSVPAGI